VRARNERVVLSDWGIAAQNWRRQVKYFTWSQVLGVVWKHTPGKGGGIYYLILELDAHPGPTRKVEIARSGAPPPVEVGRARDDIVARLGLIEVESAPLPRWRQVLPHVAERVWRRPM